MSIGYWDEGVEYLKPSMDQTYRNDPELTFVLFYPSLNVSDVQRDDDLDMCAGCRPPCVLLKESEN